MNVVVYGFGNSVEFSLTVGAVDLEIRAFSQGENQDLYLCLHKIYHAYVITV